MPIWVERFALTVFAATFFGLVILNSSKMDWIQRTSLGMRSLSFSVFLAHTVQVFRSKTDSAVLPAAGREKKPEVEQKSEGSSSPNIVGNNSAVTIGDPKVAARLDEITKLLKSQEHDLSLGLRETTFIQDSDPY